MKIEKKYFIVLLFLLLGFLPSKAHPYYVSICQVEFNRKTHALEIALKTFADDLIQGLEKAGHKNLYLGEARENPNTDTYLFGYLKSKLKFQVDGKSVQYNFIGKEMEDGVVWSYLEITNVQDFSEIDINCSLLTEVFATQNNVIQVEKDKTIKNILLNRSKTSGVIDFED